MGLLEHPRQAVVRRTLSLWTHRKLLAPKISCVGPDVPCCAYLGHVEGQSCAQVLLSWLDYLQHWACWRANSLSECINSQTIDLDRFLFSRSHLHWLISLTPMSRRARSCRAVQARTKQSIV